jgi:hypothetical protein
MSRPSGRDSLIKEVIKCLNGMGVNSLISLEESSLDLALCMEVEKKVGL